MNKCQRFELRLFMADGEEVAGYCTISGLHEKVGTDNDDVLMYEAQKLMRFLLRKHDHEQILRGRPAPEPPPGCTHDTSTGGP